MCWSNKLLQEWLFFEKKKKETTQINTCKRHFVQEQYNVWYNVYTYNVLLFYLLLISVYSSYDVFNVHIYFTIFCPIDSNLGLVNKYFTYIPLIISCKILILEK